MVAVSFKLTVRCTVHAYTLTVIGFSRLTACVSQYVHCNYTVFQKWRSIAIVLPRSMIAIDMILLSVSLFAWSVCDELYCGKRCILYNKSACL